MEDVVLFYRPNQGKYGCFSNFYLQQPFPFFGESTEISMFIDKPVVSCHFAEKPLMLCKSAMFGDDEIFDRILKAKTPGEVKSLGREVRGYDDDVWDEYREFFMYLILKSKFESCPRFLGILLGTGTRTIAEASKTDCVWGIGVSMNEEEALNPSTWKGRNLLGNALMRTRDHFASFSV